MLFHIVERKWWYAILQLNGRPVRIV